MIRIETLGHDTGEPVHMPRAVERGVETTLTRYGADALLSGFEPGTAWVQFRAAGRIVKFAAPLPVRDKYRTERQFEQAGRTRWRALLLVIKAKLESIESGIESFDEAFLPHIVLPDGQTVKRWLEPQIKVAFGKRIGAEAGLAFERERAA